MCAVLLAAKCEVFCAAENAGDRPVTAEHCVTGIAACVRALYAEHDTTCMHKYSRHASGSQVKHHKASICQRKKV